MGSDSTSTAVLNVPDECQSSSAEAFAPSTPAAALDFQATLQLLVERARFLTAASSVAIALRQDEEFVYEAASGDTAPQPGAEVDVGKEPVRQCIEERKAARVQTGATEVLFVLAVPVIRDEKVAGFLELRGHCEFQDCDLEAVTRLAEMVTTAIDHRNAATEVESGIFAQVPTLSPSTPSLWHAPDSVPKQSSEQKSSPAPSTPAEVHKCGRCGFPVSCGRKLCVDCEQKADVAHPPAEILTTPAHESWISAHGYTIASLLVTALTFVIIYWLRR